MLSIADVQLLIATGQLAYELRYGIWRVLELAEVADLTVASGLGNRDRILQLGRVDPDECHTRLLHGSPSVQRGVIRPTRTFLTQPHRAASHLNCTADIRS